MPISDARELTVRQLCELAGVIRTAAPESRKYKQAANKLGAVCFYMEDSGALAQLLWWAKDTSPEPPPDAMGKLIPMPHPQARTYPPR